MYDIAIKDLERLPKELMGAIIEFELQKGIDEDEEMHNLQENISILYNEEEIICRMIDGYKADCYICDDPLINKMIECYYNTRTISDKMYQRMYERGMHDCMKWLLKIRIIEND